MNTEDRMALHTDLKWKTAIIEEDLADGVLVLQGREAIDTKGRSTQCGHAKETFVGEDIFDYQ